jgi:hypothetical protein
MSVKSHSRIFTRRCRLYLLRTIAVILCVCLFLQIKYGVFHLISKKTFENVFIHATVSFSKPILDCSGDPLQQWCRHEVKLCNPYLIVYENLFVVTHSVILQPKLAKGKRIGGENIQEILNQPEQDEYFHFEQNFIQVNLYFSL